MEAELRSDHEDDATADQSESDHRPRKRRRGGEVGRDWACDVPGCGKDFKSKKALNTHNNITHLGRRDFVCPHETCGRTFGYKHLLQRHLSKLHTTEKNCTDDAVEFSDQALPTKLRPMSLSVDIEEITGMAYSARSRDQVQNSRALTCPHPQVAEISGESTPSPGSSKQCSYLFSRGYDLRRHLRSEHGLEVDKEKVDKWVRLAKKTKTSS